MSSKKNHENESKRENHDDECGLLSWFQMLQHQKKLG
jgi:hypothetical protein